MTRRRRATRRWTGVIGIGVVAAIAVPPTAWAALSPASGPVSGGTAVTGPLPGVTFDLLAVGDVHAVARGSDGTLYTWGALGGCEVGDSCATQTPLPVPRGAVPAGVTLTTISAGGVHTLALGSDGNAYAWGSGEEGQLGDGNLDSSAAPLLVERGELPEGEVVTAVSAGALHSVALGSDGRVYSWGADLDGEAVPQRVPLPDGVRFTAVSAGLSFSLALDEDGRVHGWGTNEEGQLGNGTTSGTGPDSGQAVPVPGVRFTAIDAGAWHSVALGDDGDAYAWGWNYYGQAGDSPAANVLTPLRVSAPAGVDFTAVAAGEQHSLALGDDGQVYVWGSNEHGALGDGTTATTRVPVRAALPTGVTAVSVVAGWRHSAALTSAGAVYSWGSNGWGQLGDGSTVSALTPVRVVPDLVLDRVLFGDLPGTDPGWANGAWSATTPAHTCGPVDVTVEHTQYGVSREVVVERGFTFGTPPTVTAQPASAGVALGGTFTATVAAAGDPVPAVQWQQSVVGSGWVDVPGATAATLSATVDATTSFRAVLTSCAGSVTSAVATATVPGGNGGPGGGSGSGGGSPTLPVTGAPGVLPLLLVAAGALVSGFLLRRAASHP